MLVVGLTGSIGSGKTTVANLFAKLGSPVIDADLIARDLTSVGTDSYQKILERFGPKIITNGQLDRKKLRDIIFNHDYQKKWLEELLHPLVIESIKKQLHDLKNTAYCIVVIPLLIETGPYAFINRILIVETEEELQLERLQKRDNTSIPEIQKILKTQASKEDRQKHAHDILINHGDLAELENQVKDLHHAYSKGSL